jgi:alpha-mannosidase
MKSTSNFNWPILGTLSFTLLFGIHGLCQEKQPLLQVNLPPAYIVPNFHPASCGWLTNWSTERNYCANSYLDHLDRVRDDSNYQFVLSECNTMIAIQNFAPDRFEEIKTRIKEGRVELPNAFFLEPTINLSGGEALVKMGIEGLRWQKQVMGITPRFCWAIDVCGTHEQMPQICAGLGLEALIYTRCNRSGKTIFWSESPDGSKVMTFVPGHYSDFGHLFHATEPLTDKQLDELKQNLLKKTEMTPSGAPLLVLGGYNDYSLAPANHNNPTDFLKQWKIVNPTDNIQIATFSNYFDAVKSSLNSGKTKLSVVQGGTGYTFDSFWIENPKVKTWYRRSEHALQTAEMLSAISSLKSGYLYPVQNLYHSWLLMLLNMDRNTLWGSAGGMVFEHETSWDVRDRFEWIEKRTKVIQDSTTRQILGKGLSLGLFNAANWKRSDPLSIKLPVGTCLAGITGEAVPDGTTICQIPVPSVGIAGFKLKNQPLPAPKEIMLPKTIETKFYSVQIDPSTGAITSLKIKPSLQELLSGPANVLVAEKHTGTGDPGDFTDPRPKRPKLATSNDYKPTIIVTEGPLAFTVKVNSIFYGGAPCVRLVRFYKNYERIDFETELNDIPNLTVVVAEFPLSQKPQEIRRGIPFGFSHSPWAKPNDQLSGLPNGIQPAVRWSDYAFDNGSGLAILDRGLSGREINDKTPVIYLYNATEKYYGYVNSWLSGKGKHKLEYAIVPHSHEWNSARIPQIAWEYNCPLVIASGCAAKSPQSFVQTSDNIIVEVIRREGSEIELRMAECLGKAGNAKVTINLPHTSASLTDLLGGHPQLLNGKGSYSFAVRPQQIVTIRLHTSSSVEQIKPLMAWDEMVPAAKRAALNSYQGDKKGHPPKGK